MRPRPALALSGKHGVWQADAAGGGGTAVALWWQLASARAGGQWRHDGREFRLLGSRPIHPHLVVHGNLAHAYDGAARQQRTTWGLAMEHTGLAALPALVPLAEVYGDDRDPATRWNLGLRYGVMPERLSLDVAYGSAFGNRRSSLLQLGFKLGF